MGGGRHKLGSEDPTKLLMNSTKPKHGSSGTWQVQVANCSKVLLMTGCAAARSREM